MLPEDIRQPLVQHPERASLLEVVLDLGRRPEARFLGQAGGQYLREAEVRAGAACCKAEAGAVMAMGRLRLARLLLGSGAWPAASLQPAGPSPHRNSLPHFTLKQPPLARLLPLNPTQITKEDLALAVQALGDFGGDNRAGVEGTLHRISGGRVQGLGQAARRCVRPWGTLPSEHTAHGRCCVRGGGGFGCCSCGRPLRLPPMPQPSATARATWWGLRAAWAARSPATLT